MDKNAIHMPVWPQPPEYRDFAFRAEVMPNCQMRRLDSKRHHGQRQGDPNVLAIREDDIDMTEARQGGSDMNQGLLH